MPIPLTVLIYDTGAGGVPTTINPVNLSAKIDDYQHAISDRAGFGSMSVGWNATPAEVAEWGRADTLRRPVAVYSPTGRLVWQGFVKEVSVTLGIHRATYSLNNMANLLRIKWGAASGEVGTTSDYESTRSQAMYGVKMRTLSASTTSSDGAEAAQRAQTALNAIAMPTSRQATTSGAGTGGGGIRVELQCAGEYDTLSWLLTENTSTTLTQTSAQVAALITDYNSTNNWFSSETHDIVATGVNATEEISADTSYQDAIEKLLSYGNSSKQRLAWGVYEDRRFSVAVWAGATPTTITYYESTRDGTVRDAYGTIVPPWELRPNAMALLVDTTDAAHPDAVDTAARKYVARVTCRISGGEASATLEPDDVDSLDNLLNDPAGASPAATSERASAFTSMITSAIRPYVAMTDNIARYNPTTGVWREGAGGTGVPNTGTLTVPTNSTISTNGGTIDTGGGSISNTGGGNIDLGTGAGIGGGGSGGVSTGGGTIDTGGGDITTGGGSIDTAGGSITNTGGGNVDLSTLVDGSGTAGRVAEWLDSDTIQSSTLIKSGAGVVTLSSSTTLSATLSGASTGNALVFNGTNWAPAAVSAGSGTAGRVAQWATGGTTLENSNLIVTNSAVGAATLTLRHYGTNTLNLYTEGSSSEIDLFNSGYIGVDTALIKTNSGALTFDTAADTTVTLDGGSTGAALLFDGTDWAAGTLLKTNTGVLTLTASASTTVNFDGSAINDVLTFDGTDWLAVPRTTLFGSGTPGRIMEWDGSGETGADSTLVKESAGLLTFQATSDVHWFFASGGELDFDGYRLTINGSLTLNTGTVNRLAVYSSGNTIDSSTLAKSGAGVLTLSSGSAYTLTAQTSGDVVVGSGTSGRITQWNSTNIAEASTLIKSGAGVLTLSAASAYTATVKATGDVAIGSVTAGGVNHVAIWDTQNTLVDAYALYWNDGTGGFGIGLTPSHQLELSTDDAAKPSTNVWTITSDERTKAQIETWGRGLDLLRALPPVRTFVYTGEYGTEAGVRGVNFVAQEVEPVAPHWITRRLARQYRDDPQSAETEILKLNTHELIYALLNAVLELDERMTAHGL